MWLLYVPNVVFLDEEVGGFIVFGSLCIKNS